MSEQDTSELVDHYNKWRRIHRLAGESEPNEPDRENGRLYFRRGYPHPDWSALILEATSDGHYNVLRASTERRNTPVESSRASFARLQDAGKFIIFETADLLRVTLGIRPIVQQWRDEGLDSRVNKIPLNGKAKYELQSNGSAYFLAYSGGIQPYNHILPLSYEELDSILLAGFPEAITSRLNDGSSS
jgi:hypothetical protein